LEKISRSNFSMGCSLSTDSNIADLLQGECPKILAGIVVGYGKVAFGVQNL